MITTLSLREYLGKVHSHEREINTNAYCIIIIAKYGEINANSPRRAYNASKCESPTWGLTDLGCNLVHLGNAVRVDDLDEAFRAFIIHQIDIGWLIRKDPEIGVTKDQ